MAEAHPVGFQWVMEAKKRGAKVIHVDPRFTRTSALADAYVPIRAGTDIAFLGGVDQLHPEQRAGLPGVRRSPTPTRPRLVSEDFAGHRGPRRPVLRLRPGDRHLRPRVSWQYEGHPRRTTSTQGDTATQTGRPAPALQHESHGAPVRARAPERDETLQHPRCVYQILKRHFARYTPEMVEQVCGVPPGAVPRGVRGVDRQLRPRAHHRAGLLASAGPSTPSACSTSAPARSSSCCSATWAGPAAASWRCAGTPASRARPTSRRCSTCCPATCRCRTTSSTRRFDDCVDSIAAPGPEGLLGQRRRLHGQPAQGVLGRRATADNDFCFDYLPRITGDHGTYRRCST